MTKIRTIIADDEPLALNLIRSYLDRQPTIEVIAECKNGREAIDQVTRLQPDLIFLDIQMPGLTGFDVIKQLQTDIMPLVVFVTAYDRFALDAFDVHAVDYILKPLEEAGIERAVSRCAERLGNQADSSQVKPQIINALDDIDAQQHPGGEDISASEPLGDASNTTPEPGQYQKIVVKDRSAITLLDQYDIDWVDAAGDYMCIHANNVTHIMRSTMKQLIEQLDPSVFKRVHRSTVVNLSRIEKIIPHTKGEYFLELCNQERIKVSRNYRSTILAFIEETSKG
ncbi:MAG: LytTR family DNA-binding domain-containing protein [Pseudomonadota bacterium]